MKKLKIGILRFCIVLFAAALIFQGVGQDGYAAAPAKIIFKKIKMADTLKGKAFYPNGAVQYDGGIVKGQPSGQGKLYTAKGKLLYDGQFKDGKLFGKGKLFDSETGYLFMEGTFNAVLENHSDSNPLKIKFVGTCKGTGFSGKKKVKSFEGILSGTFDGYAANIKLKGKLYIQGNGDMMDIGKQANAFQVEFAGQAYQNGKLLLDGTLKGSETKTKVSCTMTGKMYYSQKDLNGSNQSDSNKNKEETNVFKGQLFVDGKKYFDGTMSGKKPIGSTKQKYTFNGKLYQDGKLYFQGNFDESGMSGACKLFYPNGKLMYEGQMKNNKMNGTGKIYDQNGKVIFKGTFKNGSPVK